MKKLNLQQQDFWAWLCSGGRTSLSDTTSLAQRLLLFLAILVTGVNSAWANYNVKDNGDGTSTITWDFAEYTDQLDLQYASDAAETGVKTETYQGLTIVGGNKLSGTQSASDYIKNTAGFHGNGASSSTIRHIKYTPEFNGTLKVTFKSNNNDDAANRYTAINTSVSTATVSDGSITQWSNNAPMSYAAASTGSVTAELLAGTQYYIYFAAGGQAITKLEYTYSNSTPSGLTALVEGIKYHVASNDVSAYFVKNSTSTNNSNKTIGGESYTNYEQIAKNGSTTGSYIKFHVAGATTISIAALSASTSARTITLSNGTDVLGTVSAQASNSSQLNDVSFNYTGGESDIYIYNAGNDGGINVYGIYIGTPGFTITYNINGHGEAIPDVTEATALPATFPTPTATGYNFGGWYTEEGLNDAAVAGAAISANTTLYAKWTAIVYEIKYPGFDGTHGDNHPTRHTYGTATTLVNPTKAGYIFEGWYDNSSFTGSAISVIGATQITANINLYAKWASAGSSECAVTNVMRGETALAYDEETKTYTLTIPYDDKGDRMEESTPVENAYGITFEISAGATVTSSDSKGDKLSSPFKVWKSCKATAGSTNSITLYVTAEDGTTTAEYKIKLVRGPKPVTNIVLNKSSVYLHYNQTETLTATVTPDDATNKNVNWTSDNSNVTVSNSGLVNGGSATMGATATITATAADGSGVSANCKAYFYRFSLGGGSTTTYTVGNAGASTLVPVVFPDEGGNVSLNTSDFSVSSSNASVINITSLGYDATNKRLNFTPTVGQAGTAIITITYIGSNTNYTGKSCTINYTVNSNASDSNPEIVTSKIHDNEFEGLTVTGTTSGTYGAWSWEKNGGNGPKYPMNAQQASTAAEFWNGTPTDLHFNLSQTLTDLPAGTYKVSFRAKNVYDGETVTVGNTGFACLYADVEGSMHATQIATGAEPNEYSVIFKVAEGQNVTIGAKSVGDMDARWFWCDDFTLTYYGTNSAQAETGDATKSTVGNTNNTSGYNSEHSLVYSLPAGKTRHISFVNHSDKTELWRNWILSVASDKTKATGAPDLMILRADNWDNLNNGDTHNSATAHNFDWGTFKNDMDGATVEMDVTNSGKHIYVNATITTAGGAKTYKYSAISNDRTVAGNGAYLCLTTENAHLTNLNVGNLATAYKLTYGIYIEGVDNVEHTECGRIEIENAQGLPLRDGTFVPKNEDVKYSAIPNVGYTFKEWTSHVTSAIRDINVSGTAIAEGVVIPRARFAKEYSSTTWTFEEGNGAGTYPENGIDLVVTGGSWSGTGMKLNDGAATITLTPNAAGTLTVSGAVFKGSSSLLIVTQNGETLNCQETEGGVATYTVAAGQQVTIKRAGSEIRISEIKFTPTEDAQLTAPLIAVENGIVTFTNPNAGTTLYFKYDRTKADDISDSNFDSYSTLEVKQIKLPYGTYPADWIQAQVRNGAQSSAITKYPTAVIVKPEVPTFTKEGTAINFTAPEGCTLRFHVGNESAEAINVSSKTATVTVNTTTKKMTINGTEYNATTFYVETVAEYNLPDSQTSTITSDAVAVEPETTNVASVTIPETLEVYVGQTKNVTLTATWLDPSGSKDTGPLVKRWVITSGADYLTLANNVNTTSKITGKKSNTSDNATARVKVTVDGVESNECTITIKRTPLAVRADHIALSHNGSEPRTPHAVAYNPYTRAIVGGESIKSSVLTTNNLTITAVPKSGSSAFATFENGTFVPTGTAIGTETWVVTVAPKTTADKDCYKSGKAEIEVTCRDYLYAYSTSVPATTPTARPVQNADEVVALNYFAGHNPANCKEDADADPLKTWGSANRRPQEQVIATYTSSQKPYARIHGWEGIKNVAEPTMNSLSEQHNRNASPVYNGNSNGTFTYKQYQYYGTHDEFNVPVMGSFYRFYPEKNGTMIAYLCVNGQFSDSEMSRLAENNETQTGYANRSTYFLDPYANSMDIQNATIQPTSTIHPGFFYYTLQNCKVPANLTRDIEALLNNWAKWGNDEKDANGNLVIPVKSTSYAAGKSSYSISDVDWTLFKKLADDKVGIFHQPIANGDGSFRAITKTYVRCEIPVEKGRVYYVSPTGTKTRMAGVEFVPENDPVATDVNYYNGTISAQTNTAPYNLPNNANQATGFENSVTMTPGNYYNVTLADRTFKAGQWYSFCMPFDVPEKQIHDIFGEGAVTIHFDNVSETTVNDVPTLKMNFWSHFYDQVRAGRPIMIKMPETFPTTGTDQKTLSNENKTLTNVKFNHVKYNPVEESTLYMQKDDWTFKGSYTPVTMGVNAVILNNETFYHYKTTAKTLAGNRAWIQGPAATAAKYNLVTTLSMFNEYEGETATGIEEVLEEMGLKVKPANNVVYNINGQVMDKNYDVNNLPKGIYIVNGKKMVVK